MPQEAADMSMLAHLPLRARRIGLRLLWQARHAIGQAPVFKLDQLLKHTIRVSGQQAKRLDEEIGYQDLLSALEWAAIIVRSKSSLVSDSQLISFDSPALLEQLSRERKPVIFAPLHMGCFALPLAKMMNEYFADRPMLILRAREDRPEETLAMQRISEIGVDMRFLNVSDKQQYFDAVRFAREGAIIVSFVDLPASYGGAVSVTLFGRPAKLAMGIGSLARLTGAVVVPLAVQSHQGGDIVKLGRPFESYETGHAEKARVTEVIRRHIEQSVLACPEQWHMWPRFQEFIDYDTDSEAA